MSLISRWYQLPFLPIMLLHKFICFKERNLRKCLARMMEILPIIPLKLWQVMVPFFNVNVVNKNYFVAEIDSTTLANLADPYVKVKNKLNKTSIDFRVVATNEFDEHSMDVAMTPTGSFDWPSRRSFVAAVRGSWGFLADVVATGKLISPDGSVKGFALHDDGLNGDDLAGDGVYFADLPSISQNGTYQWEISMSNKGGTAHTTRIGTSLPDTIPFVEKN